MKRIRKRIGSAGRAVAYAAIAVAAISTLRGTAQSGDSKEEGWTARLMSAPFGRVLVIAIGITIIVLGVRLVRRGIKKKFTEDLAGGVGQEVIRLGQAGYIVKGIAYAVVGGLFGWAADHLRRGEGRRPGRCAAHRARRPVRFDPADPHGARAGLLRRVLLLLGPAPEGQHQQWRRCSLTPLEAIHVIDTRRGCKAGSCVTT